MHARRRRFGGSIGRQFSVNGAAPALVASFRKGIFHSGDVHGFDNLFTFARASTATYFDHNGVLQTAASGEARTAHHKWDGSAWTNKGLLLESEARTNLVTDSDDLSSFSELTTSGPGSSVRYWNADQAVAPDGTTTAAKLVESDNSDQQRIYKAYTVTSGVDYVWSVFARAAERNYVGLRTTDTSSGPHLFDLSAGTVHTNPSGTATIENCGNGWYRCSVTFTTISTTDVPWVSISDDGVNDNYVGDGSSGIYVWGAQLEEGSTPSSHIPTNGSTATRAAETLTIAAANMPTYTDAVCFAVKGEIDYADEGSSIQEQFFRWWADSSNYIRLRLSTVTTRIGQVLADQNYSGTGDSVSSAEDTLSPGPGIPFAIASRHGSTFINAAIDGTALSENGTPTALVDLSSEDFEIAPRFMGTIESFVIWNEDIGNAGIEEASA